jgi:hypothetical protein
MNGWMGIRTTFNIKTQKYTKHTRKKQANNNKIT